MIASFSISRLAYTWSAVCTLLSALGLNRWSLLVVRDVAQSNSQFKKLQHHYLVPHLLVLLAESIQAPYLYVLYHLYGYLPSQIAVLYVVGMTMNVISTVFALHLLQKCERRLLCLFCIATGSLACLLKFSDNFFVLLFGRLLDGFSAALIIAPFQQWYGHQHLLVFDFPREWLVSTFTVLSTAAGFLSVSAGYIAEFAESITNIAAFPFFFSILFQIAGGCYIMYFWPNNRLDATYRTTILDHFSRSLTIFKKKKEILLLCIIHTLFESAVMIFIFIWAPIFLQSKLLVGHRISFGGVYAAFMSSTLLGNVAYQIIHWHLSPSQLLLASSASTLALITLVFTVIPSNATGWTISLYHLMLLIFCVFEFMVSIHVSTMNRLQAEILPGEERNILLATLRFPLTVISGCSILIFHSGSNDLQLIITQCILLTFATLTALIYHTISSQHNSDAITDHFLVRTEPDTFNSIYVDDQPALLTTQ